MKRKSVFGILLVGILLLNVFSGVLVRAQNSSSSSSGLTNSELPYGINLNQLEAANGKVINISSNLGYLGQQWQKILFANPVFSWINGALHTISPVFKVVMAQDYAFSISFLATLIVWIFFFLSFNKIFKDYTSFSSLVALGVAFLVTVIFSQIKIIGGISNFIIWLIFGTGKPWWMQIIIGVLCVAVLAVIFIVIATFGKVIAKNKQKKEDFENRLEIETGVKSGEALTKAMSIFKRKK